MLQLRVFGDPSMLSSTAEALGTVDGVQRILIVDAVERDAAVLWADVGPVAADEVLSQLDRVGVTADDFVLARLDVIAPTGRRATAGAAEGFAWVQVLGEARANARPLVRFSVLMMVAGVIAALGVIDDNTILIVGAMAVSPDLLPICAACVGVIGRRGPLTRQAMATLLIGLGLAVVVAAAVAAALNATGSLPKDFTAGASALGGLTSVDYSTVIIALAAGIAAMLAFETRASAAVGVAISVTTIPASAYLGVSLGAGQATKGLGALEVLAVNVTLLIVSGSTTLAVQQWAARRYPRAGRR